jgi:hypothetical protein
MKRLRFVGNNIQIDRVKTPALPGLQAKGSVYKLPMNNASTSSCCGEGLLAAAAAGGSSWDDLQDVEPHSFRQRPALANDDMVTFLDTEAWGDVSRNVGMPLLIPLIFLHKVEVVPANNDSPVHLSTMACSSNDSASDRNSSSEWALLINVCPFNCFPGGLEAKANALPEAVATLAWLLTLARLL